MTDREKFEEEALAEFLEMTGIPKERINYYSRVNRVEFHSYGETYELKNPGLAVMLDAGSPGDRCPVVYFPKKPQGISEPVISHSEISGLIYVCFGGEKYEITKYAIEAVEAIKALEQEPTSKNCRTCKNFGSHHGICEICKDNKCWIPTTKNDLGVDCISREQALEPYKILENTDTLSVYTIRQNFAELPSIGRYDPYTDKFIKEDKS